MIKFVVFSILLALSNATPRRGLPLERINLNIGLPKINPRLDGRIVGGEAVVIEDYPYQLSLGYYGGHICGASLISSKFAVTAAHCTEDAETINLSIRAGSTIRNNGGVVINVAKVHQNPNFDSEIVDYDISILELEEDIKFEDGIQAIDLPDQDEYITPGSMAVCTGWGSFKEGGSLPAELQMVEVPIVSLEDCQNAYEGLQVTERMICAGYQEGGKDTCDGDSGGPLVVNGELVGIVSWGYGCARPNYPGVYSNVPNLRYYITEITGL